MLDFNQEAVTAVEEEEEAGEGEGIHFEFEYYSAFGDRAWREKERWIKTKRLMYNIEIEVYTIALIVKG